MASDLVPAFVELRRLHAEAVSNAGGDFEVDCDEAFRIFCMKNVPALLDAAERCAAAEAQAKAAGELLRAAKDVLHNYAQDANSEAGINFYGDQDHDAFHALQQASEAAERAGVKP